MSGGSPPPTLARRLCAESLGTAFLVAAVIASGVMAERLAGGNVALALLANTLATAGALVALIVAFAPLSGAHFNPIVTLVAWRRRRLAAGEATAFVVAQLAGALAGVLAAHAMFGLPPLAPSSHARAGVAQLWSEFVATVGLVLVVVLVGERVRDSVLPVALAVAAYVAAGYWFTASTCFANPAVTFGRCWSDTFAGIRPRDVPGFLGAQVAAGAAATLLLSWLVPPSRDGGE